MSNTPRTLIEEFPDQLAAAHALKAADPAFAEFLQDPGHINDQVHRAETRLDTISEEAEHALSQASGVHQGRHNVRPRNAALTSVWEE